MFSVLLFWVFLTTISAGKSKKVVSNSKPFYSQENWSFGSIPDSLDSLAQETPDSFDSSEPINKPIPMTYQPTPFYSPRPLRRGSLGSLASIPEDQELPYEYMKLSSTDTLVNELDQDLDTWQQSQDLDQWQQSQDPDYLQDEPSCQLTNMCILERPKLIPSPFDFNKLVSPSTRKLDRYFELQLSTFGMTLTQEYASYKCPLTLSDSCGCGCQIKGRLKCGHEHCVACFIQFLVTHYPHMGDRLSLAVCPGMIKSDEGRMQ